MLSKSKDDRPVKGKEANIAKWEAEIRASIAAKKSSTVSLTKQQQAAVDAQLDKEAKIRENVAQVQKNIERGLGLVQSVIRTGSEELRAYVTELIGLLVKGPLKGGSFLAGEKAFETFLVSEGMDLGSIHN